ncbi:hypothetical protein FOL47_000644 [Perkinsus chesapeaki]|uniref:C3H1-type domain-containing protein n=1 Tax=Perkinsus chesapeaki TaxID=330153 RepID=A0A7J6KW60_PERCH|nr:hypothetical protein FOL47_000644 [Perkinsus chesapeaki]
MFSTTSEEVLHPAIPVLEQEKKKREKKEKKVNIEEKSVQTSDHRRSSVEWNRVRWTGWEQMQIRRFKATGRSPKLYDDFIKLEALSHGVECPPRRTLDAKRFGFLSEAIHGLAPGKSVSSDDYLTESALRKLDDPCRIVMRALGFEGFALYHEAEGFCFLKPGGSQVYAISAFVSSWDLKPLLENDWSHAAWLRIQGVIGNVRVASPLGIAIISYLAPARLGRLCQEECLANLSTIKAWKDITIPDRDDENGEQAMSTAVMSWLTICNKVYAAICHKISEEFIPSDSSQVLKEWCLLTTKGLTWSEFSSQEKALCSRIDGICFTSTAWKYRRDRLIGALDTFPYVQAASDKHHLVTQLKSSTSLIDFEDTLTKLADRHKPTSLDTLLGISKLGKEEKNQTPVCRGFKNGNCKYGDKCRFQHVIGVSSSSDNVKAINGEAPCKPEDNTKEKVNSKSDDNKTESVKSEPSSAVIAQEGNIYAREIAGDADMLLNHATSKEFATSSPTSTITNSLSWSKIDEALQQVLPFDWVPLESARGFSLRARLLTAEESKDHIDQKYVLEVAVTSSNPGGIESKPWRRDVHDFGSKLFDKLSPAEKLEYEEALAQFVHLDHWQTVDASVIANDSSAPLVVCFPVKQNCDTTPSDGSISKTTSFKVRPVVQAVPINDAYHDTGVHEASYSGTAHRDLLTALRLAFEATPVTDISPQPDQSSTCTSTHNKAENAMVSLDIGKAFYRFRLTYEDVAVRNPLDLPYLYIVANVVIM